MNNTESNVQKINLELLTKESFDYWFTDNADFRSPFPKDIQHDLRIKSVQLYNEWIENLPSQELNKMPDNEILEFFEMILFNEAIKLVKSEEEKITICYPFMPRIGDKVNNKEKGMGVIIARKVDKDADNKQYMQLIIEAQEGQEQWETKFELPV